MTDPTAHGYQFNNERIPEVIATALDRYIRDGIHPGDFLFKVLSNDLYQALALADGGSYANLKAIVGYLHWEAPSACHGNPERAIRWIEAHK